MRAAAAALLVAALLAAAGCGADDEATRAPTTAGGGASAGLPAPGGGLSIREALDSDVEGPLLVRGYLVRRDGELRLCDGLRESYPPQCVDPSLRVEGRAPAPSEERVSLLGEVEDGTLVVSATAVG